MTVDVALLEHAAQFSPLLLLALAATVVGVVLALIAAPRGHHAWSLFGLLAPIVALITASNLELRSELHFACVEAPALEITRTLAICAGLATLAFVQLFITLCLRAWRRELRVLWPVSSLVVAIAASWAAAWPKYTSKQEFEQRVRAVTPVPNISASVEEAQAHVGKSVRSSPWVQAAGRRTAGFLFISESRVAMSDDDKRRWHVDTVELTPEHEGVNQVSLHFEQDLVSVDVELPVIGVRDEGPRWFPLAVGNRWEFAGVYGRGGTLKKLLDGVRRKKRPIPDTSFTLEVTSERDGDGFHWFEITERRRDGTTTTYELMRRNGELFSHAGRVAYDSQYGCVVQVLTPSRCTCDTERVLSCRDVRDAMSETFTRFALAFVTLGMTELHGMGDMGAGNESGVLMTKWVLGGASFDVSRSASTP
ncbi:MAG: hypothetical protein ACO1OB_29650 [Archangium sp.]